MASGAVGKHNGAALRQARDTREQARQTRAWTVRVAEAVAITQDSFADLMEELATVRPQQALRLRALSEQARQQARHERARASSRARAVLDTAAGAAYVPAQPPGERAGPGGAGPGGAGPGGAAALVAQAALWELVDGFGNGVALVDGRGAITRASRGLEETFGYQPGELAGHMVEDLVPPALREAHGRLRSAYTRRTRPRLSDDRPMLAGMRKDGTVFPVEISLSAVRAAAGPLTLALVRRTAKSPLNPDLVDADAPAAGQAACRGEIDLLDRVITGLFTAGLCLQTPGSARGLTERGRAELLNVLDSVIKDVRDHVFEAHGNRAGRVR